jgi:hypothetical protein
MASHSPESIGFRGCQFALHEYVEVTDDARQRRPRIPILRREELFVRRIDMESRPSFRGRRRESRIAGDHGGLEEADASARLRACRGAQTADLEGPTGNAIGAGSGQSRDMEQIVGPPGLFSREELLHFAELAGLSEDSFDIGDQPVARMLQFRGPVGRCARRRWATATASGGRAVVIVGRS